MARATELRPSLMEFYPGRRSGCIENLSGYSQDGKKVKTEDDFYIDNAQLSFDIERIVRWPKGKLSFTYSMMINGYYPVGLFDFRKTRTKPTRQEFIDRVSQLEGFVLDEKVTARLQNPKYVHSDRNIFVNWTNDWNSLPKRGRDRICIGVIQKEEVPELKIVIDEILPYAVSTYNHLNPERRLNDEVVERSIKMALESDKHMPRRRGSRR